MLLGENNFNIGMMHQRLLSPQMIEPWRLLLTSVVANEHGIGDNLKRHIKRHILIILLAASICMKNGAHRKSINKNMEKQPDCFDMVCECIYPETSVKSNCGKHCNP